ncbi:uncharacterized protein CMU_011220 [Cryptosporidium muris RN66]|uniref:Ribosome control protein 1 domain-containing protein n=1 Tax=Cryptosporidium muris (strain RN66) TaxID=441375 RepID=B6AIY2_CRYMR|nr:uncharacterized protein CMU_011220 [Cryptosporidium muris RN66]EEA08173.1 hypothetical protein, conserved [Cryptosporidium muris RN66]|eukprot:XP_002142522.1 hypothetical protein [Cryptosporidium muris RN66]
MFLGTDCYNTRTYNNFVNNKILTCSISPCGNYLALITTLDVVIVSNRRYRVLLCRSTLRNSETKIDRSDSYICRFHSDVAYWTSDSKYIFIKSMDNSFIFVYEFYRDSTISINTSLNQTNEVLLYKSSSEPFLYIAEEIENGIFNLPELVALEDIADNIREDLITFQLICEYGTAIENIKAEVDDTNIETDFNSNSGTSHAYIRLNFMIKTPILYGQFIIISNNGENKLLVTSKDFPIIWTMDIHCRNEALVLNTVYLTNLIASYNSHGNLVPLPASNNLFDISGTMESVVIPVYAPLTVSDSLSDHLKVCGSLCTEDKRTGEGSYTISTDFSQNSYDYIKPFDLSIQDIVYELLSLDGNINTADIFGLMQLLNMINMRSFYNGNTDISYSCNIENLRFDSLFNFLGIILNPWKSLLIFTWDRPLLLGIGLKNKDVKNSIILPPIGFILKYKNVVNFEFCGKYNRIAIITNNDTITNFSSSSLEEDVIEGYNKNHSLKDYFIEIYSISRRIATKSNIKNKNNIETECKSYRCNLAQCIFSLRLSSLFSSTTTLYNPWISCSSNCDFFMICTESHGVLFLNILTGKIVCKPYIIDKKKSEDLQLYTVQFSAIISSDLCLLIQLKRGISSLNMDDYINDTNYDEENSNFQLQLLEIPFYRMTNCTGSLANLDEVFNFQQQSCENAVLLGIDNLGVLQPCSRTMESDNQINYCDSFIIELTIQKIPLPPSIYTCHNWPFSQASLNKSGNFIALSGYRGIAIYDLSDSRWRLFADISHELLLTKPNLPMGWLNEWVIFLCVRSDLLLETFYNVIANSDHFCNISLDETHRLYERYIEIIRESLRKQDNQVLDTINVQISIVFFDVRNSLDIRNIIGIIPFCSCTPLIVVQNSGSNIESFFVYTQDFILTSYQDDKVDSYSPPIHLYWMIDLSEIWIEHPKQITLISENQFETIFLVLHEDSNLYKIAVYHNKIELLLNKKAKFNIECLNHTIDNLQTNFSMESALDNVINFGFVSFNTNSIHNKYIKHILSKEEFSKIDCSKEEIKDKLNQNIVKQNKNNEYDNEDYPYFQLNQSEIVEIKDLDYTIGYTKSVNLSFNGLSQNQQENSHNIEIWDLFHNQHIIEQIKIAYQGNDNKFGTSEPIPPIWDSIDLKMEGVIWYQTCSQQIFMIPTSFNNSSEQNTVDNGTVLKYKFYPIQVCSFQMSLDFVYTLNIIPALGSTFSIVNYSSPDNLNSHQIVCVFNSYIPILIQEIFLNNGKLAENYITRFLIPIIRYSYNYPNEFITSLIQSIFERIIRILLVGSVKDYYIILGNIIDKVIELSYKSYIESFNKQEFLDFALIYGPTVNLTDEQNLLKYIFDICLRISWYTNKLERLINILKKLFFCTEFFPEHYILSMWSNIIILCIRRANSLIAPSVIFPLIQSNPIDMYLKCIQIKDYESASLYLTLIQSFVGPWIVRRKYTLYIIENMFEFDLSSQVLKYYHLYNQLINFIFTIFKSPVPNINTPLSEQDYSNFQFIENLMEYSEIYTIHNTNINSPNLLGLCTSIDQIIAKHIFKKLTLLEWSDLIIMSQILKINLKEWIQFSISQYSHYLSSLWLRDFSLTQDQLPYSSEFTNLVICIKCQFHLFNVEENQFYLYEDFPQDDDESNSPIIQGIKIFDQSNKGYFQLISGSIEISKQFFKIVLKPFFNIFLTLSMPIQALAIAYACNDYYSVKKVILDFPNIKLPYRY